MYSDVWSPTLRQGDVLGPVPVPMVGNQQEVLSRVASPAATVGGRVEQVLFPLKSRYVAVVSHDCEFNEGKRDRLLLARIQGAPKDKPDVIEALRRSNDIEARHAAGEQVDGVDNYLLEPIPGEFDWPHVVVFSTIMPFSTTGLRDFHLAKKAELEHEHRLRFRTKLAWFFIRSPEDVDADQKMPPDEFLRSLGEL